MASKGFESCILPSHVANSAWSLRVWGTVGRAVLRANGIGEWADFGRCFGVDGKLFIFVLRGEEKIRLGVGTEASGVNYLFFSREFMGFSKQTNGGLH